MKTISVVLLLSSLLLGQKSLANEYTIYRGVFYELTEYKAYKMENIDGEWLTTNEWFPLTKDGYIKE